MNHYPQRYKNTLSVMGLLLLIILMATILTGQFPVGTRLNTMGDIHSQVQEFYHYMRGVFQGEYGVFYTLHNGFGTDTLPIWVYYLLSPLNIVYLFVKPEHVIITSHVLYHVYFLLMGMTASIYLNTQTTNNKHVIIFSIIYAGMGTNIVYGEHHYWHLSMVLLPILTLYLDRGLVKNQWGGYALTLGVIIFTNYYRGWMVCLGTMIYLIYRWGDFPKYHLKNYVIYSGLTGFASIGLLLPVADSVITGRQHLSDTYDFLVPLSQVKTTIETLIVSTYPMGVVNLNQGYVPLYVSAYGVSHFFYRVKTTKDKRFWGIVILLLLSIFIQPLNQVWHLFAVTHGVPNRMINIFLWVFLIDVVRHPGMMGRWGVMGLLVVNTWAQWGSPIKVIVSSVIILTLLFNKPKHYPLHLMTTIFTYSLVLSFNNTGETYDNLNYYTTHDPQQAITLKQGERVLRGDVYISGNNQVDYVVGRAFRDDELAQHMSYSGIPYVNHKIYSHLGEWFNYAYYQRNNFHPLHEALTNTKLIYLTTMDADDRAFIQRYYPHNQNIALNPYRLGFAYGIESLHQININPNPYKLPDIRLNHTHHPLILDYIIEYRIAHTQAKMGSINDGGVIQGKVINPGLSPYLRVTVPHQKGWTAKVDDREVEVLNNHGWVALPIDEFSQTFELRYDPPLLKLGVMVSFVSFLILITYHRYKNRTS